MIGLALPCSAAVAFTVSNLRLLAAQLTAYANVLIISADRQTT